MGTIARRLRQHLRMAGQLQDVDESPRLEEGVVDASVLSQVDLAFVVDTTGSMGQFIHAARRQMIRTLQELAAAAPIDLRVAVVEYRDHPPQDRTFVSRAHDFTADLGEAQQVIDALRPDGGGDTPEAVYDGLRTACNVLIWLPHSHRLVVLVGDAPPHGDGGDGDCFPAGCPCGLDADAVTALLETEAISLYALPMHPAAETAFERLARFTGGESYPVRGGDAAIESFKGLLTREFVDLDFDRQVLIAIRRMPEWTVDDLCRAVDGARGRVSASLSRLGQRRRLSQA